MIILGLLPQQVENLIPEGCLYIDERETLSQADISVNPDECQGIVKHGRIGWRFKPSVNSR